MSLDRQILRTLAKKKHKEMMKSVPKSKRLPFDMVYKQLVEMIRSENAVSASATPTQETASAEIQQIQDMFIEEVDETQHS